MSSVQSKSTLLYAELIYYRLSQKVATYYRQCIISTHYVIRCCEQALPIFGITVMVMEVEILDSCIPLMHFMTENAFTITGVPDNCTVPNTQFNVQIGLRNQVITNYFAQSIHLTSPFSMVNTNNTHILSLNLLTAYGT